MSNENDDKSKNEFEVVSTEKNIILDKTGKPVAGIIIHYISPKGSKGYIEIPESIYSKKKALELIRADIKKLEEFL